MEEKWRKITAYIISRPGKKGRINNPYGESTNKIISLCENLGYCNLHNVLRHGDRRESNTDSLHHRRLLMVYSWNQCRKHTSQNNTNVYFHVIKIGSAIYMLVHYCWLALLIVAPYSPSGISNSSSGTSETSNLPFIFLLIFLSLT